MRYVDQVWRNGLAGLVWRAGMVIVLIWGTSCAPSEPVIKVEPPSSLVQENHTARVSVMVENITNLIAFEVHLSFDANALEVTELNNGDFVQADFIVQSAFNNAAGTIDYAMAQIGRPPANGSGTLFEIVFRAKAQGKSDIRFRGTQTAPAGALLSDANGGAIQAVLIDGSIDVSK
jgi:hypothetical protein